MWLYIPKLVICKVCTCVRACVVDGRVFWIVGSQHGASLLWAGGQLKEEVALGTIDEIKKFVAITNTK